MLCWLMRRRLGAHRDGELGAAARARLTAHLGRCRACAAELEALDRLRALMAMPVPEPSEASWDAFWPVVQARMAQAPRAREATVPTPAPSRGARRHLPLSLAFGSALAVAAVGALAIVGPWGSSPPDEAVRTAPDVARRAPERAPQVPEPVRIARETPPPPLLGPASEEAAPPRAVSVTPRGRTQLGDLGLLRRVSVEAVETGDPDSSAMVFRREQPDVTVIWVFGLARR